MSYFTIVTDTAGLGGIYPRRIKIITSDNLSTVTTAGYLNSKIINTGAVLIPTDVIDMIYSYSTLTNSGTYSCFTVGINGGIITLTPWVPAGFGAGGLINTQIFTSSGSYVPFPGTNNILIKLVAGGGGGSGSGLGNGAGGTGGTSAFGSVTVSGGLGGTVNAGSDAQGGLGGSTSTGAFGNALFIGGDGGNGGNGSGGCGGSSIFGGGGRGGANNAANPGFSGRCPGSGGGGGGLSLQGGGGGGAGMGVEIYLPSTLSTSVVIGVGGTAGTAGTGGAAGGSGANGFLIAYEYA